MKLEYRMRREGDREPLIRLWSEHSGWGDADDPFWSYLFEDAPEGPAEIVVAEDRSTGGIVGQLAFLPVRVAVGGRRVRAMRPIAPIVAPGARSSLRLPNPFKHPIVAMYRHGARVVRDQGCPMLYALPDPRWRRMLEAFPFFQVGQFPLLSRPLSSGDVPGVPGETTTRSFDGWGSEVDDLWREWARRWECSVVRDSGYLEWKVGQGDYYITTVERDGGLVGLVASRQKGDRQWLICDLLAADEGDATRSTLRAACSLAHREAAARGAGEMPIEKVAILAPERLRPLLAELGFEPEAYRFSFLVQPLGGVLDADAVAPERWYVTAND